MLVPEGLLVKSASLPSTQRLSAPVQFEVLVSQMPEPVFHVNVAAATGRSAATTPKRTPMEAESTAREPHPEAPLPAPLLMDEELDAPPKGNPSAVPACSHRPGSFLLAMPPAPRSNSGELQAAHQAAKSGILTGGKRRAAALQEGSIVRKSKPCSQDAV